MRQSRCTGYRRCKSGRVQSGGGIVRGVEGVEMRLLSGAGIAQEGVGVGVGVDVDCINQLVGCPTSLSKGRNTTELITLPIPTEAVVHTEIWTNDPKSSEAYVTLKPYCQLDGCLQNVHFVDPSVTSATTTTEVLSKTPKLEASPPNCLLLHHHHHHHHRHSSERLTDAYALVRGESMNPPPSISILDPITGNRIFVPPFTANAGLLLSPPLTTAANVNAEANTFQF
ncbi:hypothetical protein TcWFU_003903 [Taenia crassiceps]|uniref:Uncharacterized protein n=1 Tax=Taenia crassiceps TaxID=6207 RepID=A0ABR4QH50_9CEST